MDELRKIKTHEDCIAKGMEYMWSHQLDKAKRVFSLYKYEDRLFDLLFVECNIMDIAITGSEQNISATLNELSNLMEEVCAIKFNEKTELDNYFSLELNKAEISMYRCGMNLFLGNKFQTVKTLAEGWRYYKKLESIYDKKKSFLSPRNQHRYKFGHGSFNLAFSLIPSTILKIIKLIGISPNKQKGIESLISCKNENDIRSNYAVILMSLYTIEFEVVSESACEYLMEAIKKYNRSPYFYWIGAIICWKYCQVR